MEGQKLRRRAKRPKTRTGCHNCKARHIKCDEEKPACQNCVQSGRTCSGYPVSKEQEIALRRKRTTLQPRPLALNAIGPTGIARELSTSEREALDFFRHEVACNLPGSSSYPSWHRLLVDITVSACFSEPAVAHISAALASICRSQHFISHSALLWDSETFAEDQRSKAVSALQKYINTIPDDYSDTQAEVVLIISLLFFCYELWRSQDQAAQVHLRSGLNILYEKRRDQLTPKQRDGKRLVRMEVQPRSSLSLLLQVFIRLNSDVVVHKGEPYLWATVKEPIPASFTSLDEATVHLDALSASLGATGQDLLNLAKAELALRNLDHELEPGTETCWADVVSRTMSLASRPDIPERMQEISHSLHCWLQASAQVPFEPEQEHARILVQLQFFTLWYEVVSWRQKDEMFNDGLQNQFSYVVDLCERYIALHRARNCHRKTKTTPQSSTYAGLVPLFSLGTNLVMSACTVAFKSRDSTLRRRCVKLLASVGLQGVFDNCYLASFIQAIIDVEEQRARNITGTQNGQHSLKAQIPSEARLLEVDIDRLVMASTPEFYKTDYSHFVYAALDRDGNIEVHRQPFVVDRPTSMVDASVSIQSDQFLHPGGAP